MILNCPSCSAKYQIADSAIPAVGRNVKCAACGHYWFQKPQNEGALELGAANDSAISVDAKKGFGLSFGAKKGKPQAPHEKVRKQAHDRIILSGVLGIAVGWMLAFTIVGLGLIVAINSRNDIVAKWPKSATAFAFFGVPANLYGLEIEAVHLRSGADALGPRLIVGGVVRSVSSQTKTVPYLRINLIDEAGKKQDSWLIDPGVTAIAPNKFHTFTSLRRNPKQGKLRAIIAFDTPPPKALPNKVKPKPHAVASHATPNSSTAEHNNTHAPTVGR